MDLKYREQAHSIANIFSGSWSHLCVQMEYSWKKTYGPIDANHGYLFGPAGEGRENLMWYLTTTYSRIILLNALDVKGRRSLHTSHVSTSITFYHHDAIFFISLILLSVLFRISSFGAIPNRVCVRLIIFLVEFSSF